MTPKQWVIIVLALIAAILGAVFIVDDTPDPEVLALGILALAAGLGLSAT